MLHHSFRKLALTLSATFALSCAATNQLTPVNYAPGTGPTDRLRLPAPFDTPSARNTSTVIG